MLIQFLEAIVLFLRYCLVKFYYNMFVNCWYTPSKKRRKSDCSKQITFLKHISLYIYVFFARTFVDMEMHDALERKVEVTASDRKFIVHYLRSSMMFESVPLQRATAMCSDMPVMVIAYSDSMVKARCCVPQVSWVSIVWS